MGSRCQTLILTSIVNLVPVKHQHQCDGKIQFDPQRVYRSDGRCVDICRDPKVLYCKKLGNMVQKNNE